MNTPVSYKLAVLLKEKEFEGDYFHYWNMVNHNGEYKIDTRIWENSDNYIEAPTISEVIMWLYEKHGVWISVKRDYHNGALLGFESIIDYDDGFISSELFATPTEAYESAIEHALTNIIKP